jgi:hypothetical protein
MDTAAYLDWSSSFFTWTCNVTVSDVTINGARELETIVWRERQNGCAQLARDATCSLRILPSAHFTGAGLRFHSVGCDTDLPHFT